MQRFRFKKGLRFQDGPRQWTLLRELATFKLQLQDDSGALIQMTKDELLQRWRSGEWVLDPDCLEEISDVIYMATPRDLSTFKESQQSVAIRRVRYLTELSTGSFKSTAAVLRQRIAEVAQKLGDPKPPHCTTVYRWWCRYGQSRDATKLVDRRTRSGRRPNTKAYAFFEKAIDAVYLTPQKRPGVVVFETMRLEIETSNKHAPQDQQVACPSMPTVYRWLSELHAFCVDEARLGKRVANLKYRSVTGTVEVRRILERVEIDHTPLDLILIDEVSQVPLGRPWLTLAIDRFSRAVLGFYLAFHAPSSYSVMRCLQRCVLPKTDLLAGFKDITNTWPMHGIPMEVVFDNGMDLHADAVSKICFEMGTRVTFCPVGDPYFKGAIERMFGTLNKGLVHQLPGTVFSNTRQRGDYAAEKEAVLGIHQATHLITKWLVDVYHQRPHRSTGRSPMDLWNSQLASTVIELPAYPRDLDTLVGIPAERQKITHEGIRFENLFYNGSDLQLLKKRKGVKFRIAFKYFEDDISYIQVWDEDREEYIRVDVIDKFAEYARGLSRQLHLVTRRYGEKNFGDDWMDNAMLRAKQDIQDFVAQARKDKKMALRKKAAVLDGIHSEQRPQQQAALDKALRHQAPARLTAPAPLDPGTDDALPVFRITRVAAAVDNRRAS